MARRYAESRPDVHSIVVGHLREPLAAQSPFEAALDVGCGTGLSTRALQPLARRRVGVDPSTPMLAEAVALGGGSFVRGVAEKLPFADAAFDFLTIGCAYHWCEPDAFLSEAHRVLSRDGRLVLYDNFILGNAPGSPPLFEWLQAEHWAHLPRTPRNPLPALDSFGHPSFELVHSHFLDTWVPMSRERMVRYLTTQSGAVAAVESGQRSVAEIESFLRSGLAKLLPEEETEIRFGGPIWVVRPVEAGARR